jgi:predicted transcriptional regulator
VDGKEFYFQTNVSRLFLSDNSINYLTKLLFTLSRKENLLIFIYAHSGLQAKPSTSKSLDIPLKTYYARLKQLMDMDLIHRVEGQYRHTSFGNVFYKEYLLGMIEAIGNRDYMKLSDMLKQVGQFPEEKITQTIRSLMTNTNNTSYNLDNVLLPTLKIILEYEEMVSELLKYIQSSKEEILIATRLLDERLLNALLLRLKAGLRIKVIADTDLVNQYIQTQKGNIGSLDENHIDNSKERSNVITNPWYPEIVDRHIANVPFGIIILDRNCVGIELIDYHKPNKVYGGIFIKEKRACEAVYSVFEKLWNGNVSY